MTYATERSMDAGLMSATQDAGWWTWVAATAAGSSVLSFIAGSITKGWSSARAGGESEGEMRVWKIAMENRFADILAQNASIEARINLRLSSLEARKERIDDLMRDVPSRAEMTEGFERIGRQIEQLSGFVHGRETWNNRAP